MDWFDLLASPRDSQESSPAPQFQSISSSASAFFMVRLSQLYMTPGRTVALTIRTSVDKGMSLLFDTPSRFVIAFLPRSNRLLISWLQSPSSVILESRGGNLSLLPPFPPSICQEVMGPDVMILVVVVVVFFLLNIEVFFFKITYVFIFGCAGSLLTHVGSP